MIVDKSGSLASVKRHDYLPFGEELYAGVGGRSTGQGYTGDDVRQKFTGKERDTETGLDYFEARYYVSMQGRFSGADPGPHVLINPQSWNRYTYCLNNPINMTDPAGLTPDNVSSGGVYGFEGSGSWPQESADMAEGEAAYAERVNDIQQDQTSAAGPIVDPVAFEREFGPPPPLPGPSQQGPGTEHQEFQHAALEGTPVPGSMSWVYNCMSWALGHDDRWIQPGDDGHSIKTSWPDGTDVIIEETRPVTPGNLPGFLGGRWIHANQTCPIGTYKIKVYEDSAFADGWHVERKDYGSRTWTSKNGQSFKYTNIRNPDVFYRQQYHPAGTVTITAWCVPVGAP